MSTHVQLPAVLGRKVVGESAAAERAADVVRPALGNLARGISDRSGKALVDVPVQASVEESDETDKAELNGESSAPALAVAETPEVVAAAEKVEKAGKKK